MQVPELSLNHRYLFLDSGSVLLAVCGVALTLMFAVFSLPYPSFIAHLDGRFFDVLTRGDSPPPGGEAGPVVVALDDESLARYGRWPWSRALIARLLARITEQKPAAVGIDVIFPEAEIFSVNERMPGASLRLSGGDQALLKALTAGPFVLGFVLTFGPPGTSDIAKQGMYPLNMVSKRRNAAGDPFNHLWRATGAVGSLSAFCRGSGASGFLNGIKGQDGVLRRIPVLMEQGGSIYPSLALASVLRSLGSPAGVLYATWWGDLVLEVGDRRIPLDDSGQLLLRYRGWHVKARPVSASALLDGTAPRNVLAGRVVLLGATATGMVDQVATPLDGLLPGVQIHGIAADNILKGDFVRPAPWGYRLLVVLLVGRVATVVCVGLPAVRGAFFLAVAAAATWQGSVWLFHSHGAFLSPVFPLVTMFMIFSLLTLVRLFHVEKKALLQSHDLTIAKDFILSSMAALTGIRDTETGAHLMRTQRYLHVLCTEISRHPRFKPLLDPKTIELISKLAVLHDIGKVGIDDKLLRKAARYTAEEYEAIKKHADYGRNALASAGLRTGDFSDKMLTYAKEIAYSHHEHWDGKGYPEGVRGDGIPWVARLMAVADVYDALVSRRVYKEPVSHEDAVDIINNGRGGQFDPDVVDAFLRVEASWRQIAIDFEDSDDVELDLK